MSLAEKLRTARQETVEVGGFDFTIRRPTDLEMIGMQGRVSAERLLPHVVGWGKVRAIDMIPGGDPHPVPFDAEVCREWLADRPDLLGPLVTRIVDAYERHRQALEDAAKN